MSSILDTVAVERFNHGRLLPTHSTPSSMSSPFVQVLLAFPFYVVVVFCCYSLAVIGYGLATFPDRPDAYSNLIADITQARTALESKGFTSW